jgi:hypothetical protein
MIHEGDTMAEADTVENGAPAAPPPKPPDMVPASRLAEVAAERNALRKERDALSAEVGKSAEWRTAAETHAAELAAERSARAEERDLYRAGLLDEEAHVVARALYSAMPAEGRPATLGEYLGSLRAEGAAVPRALAGYLSEPAAKPGPVTTQPKPPAGAGKPTPSGASVTAEALRAAREHYHKTGDLEPMRRLQAAQKAPKA